MKMDSGATSSELSFTASTNWSDMLVPQVLRPAVGAVFRNSCPMSCQSDLLSDNRVRELLKQAGTRTCQTTLQDASDEAILSKDLDSMSGQKRRYYERKLQLIFDREDALEKKQKEEEEKKKIEIEEAKDNNLEDEAGIEFK
ncbi:hypothetical protein PSTG_06331 [Puccinia striiformis f. sp. tritici PST-78]|uniref:No apical meristem-associated C-terminal domain-containing protein n=1 Tax=Puccinia striiformis f. sp. tritici PST-78 TaxID=1165861 RepID=A0A0L0VM96_9BASI|nr:hypothetical protein PSTG_06331 [Puccinia striiformis f. sp. tritici PST-78]